MDKDSSTHFVGIDLGNQNSVIAVNTNGRINVCTNQFSQRVTPSLVLYGKERRYFSEMAKTNQGTEENISCTINNLKKLVALIYESQEREELQAQIQYKLHPLPNGYTGVEVFNCVKGQTE